MYSPRRLKRMPRGISSPVVMPYVFVGRLEPWRHGLVLLPVLIDGMFVPVIGLLLPNAPSGLLTQKSVRMIGIGWPTMIQPKLPIEKSAAPPSVSTFELVVKSEPPMSHSHSLRRHTITLAV